MSTVKKDNGVQWCLQLETYALPGILALVQHQMLQEKEEVDENLKNKQKS